MTTFTIRICFVLSLIGLSISVIALNDRVHRLEKCSCGEVRK